MSIRKAAAAAFEALPAILLAGALLMPALAALASTSAERAAPAATLVEEARRAIAEQGNRAVVEIREESRAKLPAALELPKLS
jgi:hypothetical protein